MPEEDEALKTAFHDVIVAAGGTHVADGGWMWAENFGNVREEYDAVRDDVAVWDVSPLNKWDFRGADALKAARRVHSNDILGLDVGQVRYGAFLDGDGLMVDDGTVFKLAEDHAWVMTNGKDHAEYFREALKGLAVEFEWIAPSMPHLGVLGPRSRDVVQELTETDLSGLRYFRFLPHPIRVGGVPVYLSRTGFGGELGYELFLTDRANAEELWDVVVNRAGIKPFGADAIEILRIEAGLIVTDYDYEAHERSPFDFNFDPFVKLDAPGEPLGRDSLRDAAKNPPNRFVTLRYETAAMPEYGAAVTKEGEDVGVLTSPTHSPRYGKIGIAVLAADQAKVGNAVDIAVGEGTVPATVDVLPLYDTQKTRPRS